MDDARRFLRYVLPGVVFAVETSALLFLFRPDLLPTVFGLVTEKSALGLGLVALFASGGLGFLFSVIHHAIHWRPSSKTIDHRPNLLRLDKEKLITLPTNDTSMTREDAWVFTSILWYTRRENNPIIKGADGNARMLTDLAHMLGTARVASAAATFAAFGCVAASSSWSLTLCPILGFLGAVALSLALGWVFCSSYLRTSRFAQRVIDGVISDALRDESKRASGTGTH